MPRKNRPVLFEVSGGAVRPGDAKPRDAARGPSMAFPQPRRSVEAIAPRPEAAGRWLERSSNGIRFELSWPMVGGLAALLLVLIGGSFAVGKVSGSSRPRIEQSAADSGLARQASRIPLAAEVAPQRPRRADNGGRREPSVAAKRPEPEGAAAEGEARAIAAAPPERIKGATYLVIQHFRKSESKAARKAQEFLQANGIDSALEEERDIRLFATQPFQIRQPNGTISKPQQQAAEQLRQRVRQLGKEFAAAGNGYAFDQCFLSEEKK